MTSFQSLVTTVYMLLARAREPVEERKLVAAPSRVQTQRARRELSRASHLQAVPMRRRRTDWPSEHAPLLQRMWQAVRTWGTRRRAGAKG
jgi:hypothetical protein